MEGAEATCSREGPAVVEVCSHPRIAQEAAACCKDGVDLSSWMEPRLDEMRSHPRKDVGPNETGVSEQSYECCDVVQALVARGLSAVYTMFNVAELSRHKRDPDVCAVEQEAGRVHLRFCMKLCVMQVQAG